MEKNATKDKNGLNPVNDALLLEKYCKCEGQFVKDGKLTSAGAYLMVLVYCQAMLTGLRAFKELIDESK